MLTQTLLLILSLAHSGLGERGADVARASLAQAAAGERSMLEARYEAEARAVTNWRLEAADDLEPRPVAAFAALIEADRPIVTRCVKLNNYWCIKSARWNGEIGKDAEGHVGFASAESGADAAAGLLRRYYLDFGRKSALDIVRRWAPADCGGSGAGGLVALAVRGIGATLRARYLASRRSPGKVSYTSPRGRISAIIPSAVPTFRVPDIAVGMGERKRASPGSPPMRAKTAQSKPSPQRPVQPGRALASTERPASTGAAKPVATVCTPDEQRIRNYAARIVQDLGLEPTDDLGLFAPDGTPLPNLTQVMLAMSSVELGLLRASGGLIDGAVERAVQRAREKAAQDNSRQESSRQETPGQESSGQETPGKEVPARD